MDRITRQTELAPVLLAQGFAYPPKINSTPTTAHDDWLSHFQSAIVPKSDSYSGPGPGFPEAGGSAPGPALGVTTAPPPRAPRPPPPLLKSPPRSSPAKLSG